MTWILLQHEEFEGPGILAPAFERHGVVLRPVRLDAGDAVPALQDVPEGGGILSMGGPMNALDDSHFPYLPAERSLLAAAARAGLPVLGVCLGAQILAAGLGAAVTTMPCPELGVADVTFTVAGLAEPAFAGSGPTLPAVLWHGDTFALPAGAVLLAGTEHCPHQAFRWGARAYGLQFHPEMTSADMVNAGAALPVEFADHERLLPPGAAARAAFVERLVGVLTGTADRH